MVQRLSLLVVIALAGCVSAPPPPPVPRPLASRPTAARPVAPSATVEAPLIERSVTPGAWRYAASSSGSTARFGAGPLFEARCDRAARRVALTVAGAPSNALTLRASTTARTVAADPSSEGSPEGSVAQLGSTDPILDALAFSRGSFAVTAGATTLTLPAWPEFTRVIEDCRG